MTSQILDSEVDSMDAASRVLWLLFALISFALMVWWSKLGPLLGFEHHPTRACVAGIIFFIVGVLISIADEGGLGEDLG